MTKDNKLEIEYLIQASKDKKFLTLNTANYQEAKEYYNKVAELLQFEVKLIRNLNRWDHMLTISGQNTKTAVRNDIQALLIEFEAKNGVKE